MTPHKVLLFIPHLQQGGAERQILELMTRLPARYAPTLCLYAASDKDRIHYRDYLPQGEPRHVLGVDEMGPIGLARLIALLRREQPAILHSYRDKANFWARLAAMVAPVPIVLTSVRNRYQGPFYGPAEFVLQRRSARVLVNSVGIEEELVSWAGVPQAKIQVINNFIDLERFQPPTEDERVAARRQYGIAAHEIALILPGRLAVQKHQLGLGLALMYLKRAGRLPPHVRLLLAGRKRDKTYSRLVPAWFDLIGIAQHVSYLEPIAEVASLYHAADALVMPSLYEGLPNAVLEAHACGLPAVVSHAANRDTIVIDGHRDLASGFEVPTLDHRALAEAIGQMIERTDAERRAMGARGRIHVAARFHPDRISAETTALYDSLIAEKGL